MDYKKLKEYEPIQIIGHDNADNDSITSAYFLQKLLKYKDIESIIIIPDEKIPEEFDIKKHDIKYNTVISDKNPLFLVDHKETKYEGNVIGYIDHHENIVYIDGNNIIKPKSSCAKIIFDEMLEEGIELGEDDYYLVIKSMYLDTMSFSSQKASAEDKVWSDFYCEKYQFDRNKLYEEGLGLLNTNDIISEDLKREYKEFLVNGNIIASSGIRLKQIPNEDEVESMINNLKYIKDLNKKDFWLYYIICFDDKKTLSFLLSNDDVKKMYFDDIKSRGKDLIPEIIKLIPEKLEENSENTNLGKTDR